MSKPQITSTCRHCNATIEFMGRDIGWVDVVSGDDGGTYDICPERYDEATDTQGAHQPLGGEATPPASRFTDDDRRFIAGHPDLQEILNLGRDRRG